MTYYHRHHHHHWSTQRHGALNYACALTRQLTGGYSLLSL